MVAKWSRSVKPGQHDVWLFRSDTIMSTAMVIVRRFYIMKSLRQNDHTVCSL
jgi:hypothetical protein